jgi:hypothetical protein
MWKARSAQRARKRRRTRRICSNRGLELSLEMRGFPPSTPDGRYSEVLSAHGKASRRSPLPPRGALLSAQPAVRPACARPRPPHRSHSGSGRRSALLAARSATPSSRYSNACAFCRGKGRMKSGATQGFDPKPAYEHPISSAYDGGSRIPSMELLKIFLQGLRESPGIFFAPVVTVWRWLHQRRPSSR